jgi:tetratricopeptide (TPR) repeat protein
MSFRDEYLWTGKTYAEWSLEHSVQAGSNKSHALQIALAETFSSEISSLEASIQKLSQAGELSTSKAVQRICDSVDSGLVELRWVVERHLEISQSILNVLLNSLANESRQYYEQGVVWYEAGEYELAKARFQNALEKSSVNDFAYQYLGFVSVVENNSSEAIRNFDRAAKCASTDYHRAMAFAHLARVYFVQADFDTAIQQLSRSTQLQPLVGWYWYDLAAYHAAIGAVADMQEALRKAVNCDFVFWHRAKNDRAFETARRAAEQVLTEVAEREREHAKDALRVLLTVERFAADFPDIVEGIDRMRSEYIAEFNYVEIQGYRDLRRRILDGASQAHRQAQDSIQRRRSRIEADYRQQRENIERPVRGLRNIRDRIGGTLGEAVDNGGTAFALLLLWPLTAVAVVVLICTVSILGFQNRKIRPALLTVEEEHKVALESIKKLLLAADSVAGEIKSETSRSLGN